MPVKAGSRLGPYEIRDLLGAGGMGEVYKATDTRLDRTVAIKVMAGQFAATDEGRQRFAREARAISSLDHPHICALYDVGCEGDVDYLVMQHLEGETLAHRLSRVGAATQHSVTGVSSAGSVSRGALPLDEALRHAIQIADALHAAHRSGIVHRDLKPGNVFLTKGGVKLLDFGLAKLKQPAMGSSAGQSMVGTATQSITEEGGVVGTLQYMAPEQLEGRPTDARTDIFAFGAMLYEMLTGRKAFVGTSHATLIASILETKSPTIASLSDSIAQSGEGLRRRLDRVVRTCLAKDPDERWQSAGDLAGELRWLDEERQQGTIDGSGTGVPATDRRPRRERIWMAASFVFGLCAIGAGFFAIRRPSVMPATVRFEIFPPALHRFVDYQKPLSLSPDGRRFAFVTTDPEGKTQLWVRAFESVTNVLLAGTEGASAPFWSPDSRFIGYVAGGQLKKIDASGGPAQFIADTTPFSLGAWSEGGIILFQGTDRALHQIPAAGGEAKAVTRLDVARQEIDHVWPEFLPDGRRFIYSIRSSNHEARGIFLGSLDGPEKRRLLDVESNVAYSSGYLLFDRQQTLMAQPFDAPRGEFTGDALPIVEHLDHWVGYLLAPFDASGSMLAYRHLTTEQGELVSFDRSGHPLGTIASVPYRWPRLSPDGARVIVGRPGAQNRFDLAIIELAREMTTRFTFNAATNETDPVWSPDGTRVAFASFVANEHTIYLKPSTGAGKEEPIVTWSGPLYPTDWSPDGRNLLLDMSSGAENTSLDIGMLSMGGDRKLVPLVQTPFKESNARFSPDGRWFAYDSDESGIPQVYVQRFPPDGDRWQISTAGGRLPVWGDEGKELFYITMNRHLMGAEIRRLGRTLEVGATRTLISGRYREQSDGFAVSADGQRFLLPVLKETAPTPITVVLNWNAGLK